MSKPAASVNLLDPGAEVPLREAGLVDAERRASWVYYRPRPGSLRQLATLLTPSEEGVAQV
jgi:DNA-binding transcriptional ArsR family regulator